MTYRTALTTSFTLLFLSTPFISVASASSLDAHSHGSAELNIAVDGDSLFLEFESPADNIVGFEHAPENDQQSAAIKKAIDQLENFDAVLQLPAAANCSLISAKAEWEGDDAAAKGHTEFHAKYNLNCKNIGQLDTIDVKFSSLFPAIEDLDVQAILPNRQVAAELNAENTRLNLK